MGHGTIGQDNIGQDIIIKGSEDENQQARIQQVKDNHVTVQVVEEHGVYRIITNDADESNAMDGRSLEKSREIHRNPHPHVKMAKGGQSHCEELHKIYNNSSGTGGVIEDLNPAATTGEEAEVKQMEVETDLEQGEEEIEMDTAEFQMVYREIGADISDVKIESRVLNPKKEMEVETTKKVVDQKINSNGVKVDVVEELVEEVVEDKQLCVADIASNRVSVKPSGGDDDEESSDIDICGFDDDNCNNDKGLVMVTTSTLTTQVQQPQQQQPQQQQAGNSGSSVIDSHNTIAASNDAVKADTSTLITSPPQSETPPFTQQKSKKKTKKKPPPPTRKMTTRSRGKPEQLPSDFSLIGRKKSTANSAKFNPCTELTTLSTLATPPTPTTPTTDSASASTSSVANLVPTSCEEVTAEQKKLDIKLAEEKERGFLHNFNLKKTIYYYIILVKRE